MPHNSSRSSWHPNHPSQTQPHSAPTTRMRWPHRVGVAVAVVLGVAASAAPLLAGTSASRSGQGDTVTAVQGPVRADAGARPGR